MTPRLQQKLYKKYPKIFRQKDLSMLETAMCWGIACGDGWYWLLDALCNYLKCSHEDVEAVQVKEKFGTLRFYIQGGTSEADAVIQFAEQMSGGICERCGMPGAKLRGKGWLYTRCNTCWKNHEKGKGGV